MQTIALVADDRNVLTSVSIALKAEGYRVGTYTDRASALDGFQTTLPDLAILDMKMPRVNGVKALRLFRARSNLPVIFLTSTDEIVDEVFAFQIGVDDFIRKPFSERLLVQRVKAVLRRTSPKDGTLLKKVAANVLERGALRMDAERHTCTWKNKRVTLTASEFVIFRVGVRGPQRSGSSGARCAKFRLSFWPQGLLRSS